MIECPAMRSSRPVSAALLVLLLFSVAACESPVATALDEADANQVILALDSAGIGASKEADPAAEGKFRVMVTRDDTSRALVAMHEDQLPRARPKGVLEAMNHNALVPSPSEEHALFVAGLAGDLERSLTGVEGLLSARVHLNLPIKDPLRDTGAIRPTASVLAEHRGATPPLSAEAIQRLVAGGVAGLSPGDVSVIFVPRVARSGARDRELAHLGPLTVTQGSLGVLKFAFAAFAVLLGGLAAATLTLYARVAKLRAEIESTRTPSPNDPR